MMVEFFWSYGFAEAFVAIFEITSVALLAIIRIFFECFIFLSPGLRIVDSFSDVAGFDSSLVLKRPPKKPPDKFRDLISVRF
jgi:hypothetical protein